MGLCISVIKPRNLILEMNLLFFYYIIAWKYLAIYLSFFILARLNFGLEMNSPWSEPDWRRRVPPKRERERERERKREKER